MGNINSLNTLLRNVDSHEKLAAEYRKACPDILSGDLRADLSYCSGATRFVMGYLTGSDRIYDQAIYPRVQKKFDAGTANELLGKLSGSGILRIGYIVSQGNNTEAHECVVVGSGNQWAFYQANTNGSEKEQYTLAPKLNPLHQNWCLNDMDESTFAEFFVGLTTGRYKRLFRSTILTWSLAGFSADGNNLLF